MVLESKFLLGQQTMREITRFDAVNAHEVDVMRWGGRRNVAPEVGESA